MKDSGQSGTEIGHALVKRNGRKDRVPEILGNDTGLVIEKGLARGILQALEKGEKGTGGPVVYQAILPGLTGPEADLVRGTEITRIGIQGGGVAL